METIDWGEDTCSVPSLIRRLCRIQLKSVDKTSPLQQPEHSHCQSKRKLKLRAWETLLAPLKGPHNFSENGHTENVGHLGELEQIYATAFQLRCERRFDEAHQLEELTKNLMTDACEEDLLQNVLKLVLALTNTKVRQTTNIVGHEKKIPVTLARTQSGALLPEGPLQYGDTRQCHIRHWYTHYPREVFEIEGININEGQGHQRPSLWQVFQSQPGAHLNGMFEAKGSLSDDYEKQTQLSLYGALVQSTASSLDLTLDLPDLSESAKPPEISIPKLQEVSDDEGFAESVSTIYSRPVTPEDSGLSQDFDIWQQALNFVPCKHRVWEIVGRPPQRTECPYLTEAGPEALARVWELHMEQLRLVDPTLQLPQCRRISMSDLVADVINLLLGIPSTSFILDQTQEEFCLAPGLHLFGMTPEGTAAGCSDLLECGTLYRQLSEFSRAPVTDSFYRSGLIFQAFTEGIRKYLQHYRGCVLSIPPGKTLMEIISLLQTVLSQIRYLAQLCHCTMSNKPHSDGEAEEEIFPTGVGLLSYLYKETLEVTSSPHYPMMLSLLSTSCGPYLMFVQDWVFHGICRDTYREYMIQVNDEYLAYRDKHYWTEGYRLLPGHSVPLFLSDHANDIFVCGKSINLLKLCAPQHFLFTVDQRVPRVQVTFSEDELVLVDTTCQRYLSRMQQTARMTTLNRQQMVERTEKAKQELIVQARQAAAQELARLQDIALEKKKSEDARKRRLFAELKDEMLKDVKRRASEKEQEKEEDKLLVAARSNQEILQASVDRELERQAREELIAYYSKLSSAATLREQKALWKIRRSQLHEARQEFLQTDAAELQKELKTVHTLSDGTDVLPRWAAEGLKSSPPAFGLASPTQGDIPTWARTSTGPSVLVGDNEAILDLEFAYNDKTTVGENKTSQQVEVTETKTTFQSESEVEVSNVSHSLTLGHLHSDQSDKPKPKPQHVSDSEVGAVMRSEPVQKMEIEPTLYIGPVTIKKDAKDHPSTSTIQDLMYSDPVSKAVTDSQERGSDAVTGSQERGSDRNIEAVVHEVGPQECSDVTAGGSHPDEDGTQHQGVAENSPKTTIRFVPNKHVTSESNTEIKTRRVRKLSDNLNVMTESQQTCDRNSVKAVVQKHISQQSHDATETKHRIKMSQSMSASTESQEAPYKMHLKPVAGSYANIESQYREIRAQLRVSSSMHASRESVPEVLAPKRRNVFGHASEISGGEYDINAPKMKRFQGRHASLESDFYSYQVKPHRQRRGEQPTAEQETTEKEYRPAIRMDSERHVSKESELIDPDEKRLTKFKERNIKGHSSDSSVQRLLYGGRYGQSGSNNDDTAEKDAVISEFILLTNTSVEPYPDNFDHLCDPPVVDLLASLDHLLIQELGDYGVSASPDISAHGFVSLPALIKRSITAPLKAQISLVNQSIVNYFTSELHIEGHLKALRQFLLMRDGEFGQCLSDHLFEKLAMNPLPHEILNPMFLNNALSKALRLSIHGDSDYAHNLAFTLKYLPPVLKQNAPDALDCLELTYKVDWPMNIVITNNSLSKYSRVFSFMLQLKRAVWVLEDVWHKLKRDALINSASAGSQFRQLQLYRHEMQYFVRVMQGYIANQVIHVTWTEFKEDLSNNVHNLDNLHNCHGEYLNKCLSRCLLNPKAAPVMKIIQDIFGLILKFRMQLISHPWERGADRQVTHPMFSSMCATYNSFNDYSRFLFKVVRKLAIKGYLPHLQELLLRLNFNHYYSTDG